MESANLGCIYVPEEKLLSGGAGEAHKNADQVLGLIESIRVELSPESLGQQLLS